jgi:regulator of protease activity HflC (stomatin/prohibitin superfamily)
LIASRITDFRFPDENGKFDKIYEKDKLDKISTQQIVAWESEWIRRREGILAEAQAESDRIRQGARADAEANLLTALAEGLQKTGAINPDLPKFVIAARFLNALQSYIHQPPAGEGGEEYEKKVRELQNYLKYWQEQSFPSSGKEKQ